MAEVQFQMSQLVNLAIGSPEVGVVNFNLISKVLVEMLKLTNLESAPITLSAAEAARLEETYDLKSFVKMDVKPENVGDDNDDGSVKKGLYGHQCPINPEKVDKLLEDMQQLKLDYEDLTAKVATMSAANETVPFQEMRQSLSQVDGLQDKLKEIETMMGLIRDLDLSGDDERSLGQRLAYIEKHLESHSDQLIKLNNLVEDQLKDIMGRLTSMDKEMGEVSEKVNLVSSTSQASGKRSATDTRVSTMQEQSSNTLLSRISTIQHELDNLTTMVSSINEEQTVRQMFLDALKEEVEVLRTVKADKTIMDDVLAAKADMSQVHRKVSHDHFETKLDQLNHHLEDVFSRLDAHEEMWQEEVEELKLDIENKLDKMEFSPLKDYVNEKIKQLQDKMKGIASQRREGVASGTKKRVIRDVQCISCDNESVMKPDVTIEDMPPAPALPCQQSIRPFLTYQLDQLRKQQKKLPTGRNLLHFEEIMKATSEPSKNNKIPKVRSGEHLVNRYVGGSHTTTTPQQRVTRTGNYFETWGPVITAVNTPKQAVQ